MLTAPMLVRLPIDLSARLQERLREIVALHEKEAITFERRARTEVNADKIIEAQFRIRERAKRTTVQHLFRVLLARALDEKISAAELYELMAKDEIVVGRPTLGVKRGSRAA